METIRSIFENVPMEAQKYIKKHNLVDYYLWLMENNPYGLARFVDYVMAEVRFLVDAVFDAGVDLETVRKMAGHEDTETTKRYERRSPNRTKRSENRNKRNENRNKRNENRS